MHIDKTYMYVKKSLCWVLIVQQNKSPKNENTNHNDQITLTYHI